MSIIFFTSRMIAMMILLMLAVSFIVAVVALDPYLPKLITPRCPCPQGQQAGGVEASEGLAPAWTWQFEAPVHVNVCDNDGKVGDPWGSYAYELFYVVNIPGCGLPNLQGASLTSNATHYNVVCAFIPHASTITSPHMALAISRMSSHYVFTEITWINLDTTRVYRYVMSWPRFVTTFVENQISRIRVEQEVLPRWINMTLPNSHNGLYCSSGTSVVVRGPTGTINTFTTGTTFSRVNSTHFVVRLTVTFTAAAQVQQIEWIQTRGSCDRWVGDHLVMRVTFVDANNNPRVVNVAANDVFVFEKYVVLRQR